MKTVSIDALTKAYLQQFPARAEELANPVAARAEAATFSAFHQLVCPLRPMDPPGPDFECAQAPQFCVEVTSLDKSAIQTRSDWPKDGGGAFRPIASVLTPEVIGKAKQLRRYAGARLLALCSEHERAAALHEVSAAHLLHGETFIGLSVGKNTRVVEDVTDLKQSAFLNHNNGEVEFARRTVSAVVMLALLPERMSICGVVHPSPEHPFDHRRLRGVPFATIIDPLNNDLAIMWTPKLPSTVLPYKIPNADY
jgi:hypothetical protein